MSTEALQQQMAKMALRQQQTEQMPQQTADALRQSEQQRQAAAASAAASQGGPPENMIMVDTRLLGNPGSGTVRTRVGWTRAYLMLARPLPRNGGANDPMPCANLTPEETAL